MTDPQNQPVQPTPKKKPWDTCLFQAIFLGVILAILAVIAAPDFLRFHGGPRAKQSEAKTNLGAIFTTQVAYFGEYNTYAGGPDCFENLGWAAEGEALYSYYCGQDEIPCDRRGCDDHPCFQLTLKPSLLKSSREGFTVVAVGNVDDDGFCDVWSMRDSKFLKNDLNDLGD